MYLKGNFHFYYPRFRIDLDEKCGLVADVETPVIRMEADYELKGKLLLFPINGHGKCNITMCKYWAQPNLT